ncbi:YjfA family protein [Bacillus paralicheniformis]|uniref:YjfA family protein n=1 Tax=Bacillus paralicheniformis TaxID=1648923 RepID=UPI002151E302|nr:YjfA family protein [Bacillus paralicheniformis]
MTLDKAARSGLEANAYVKRNTDGKELSGSLAGGNGKVLPGQTFCYKPMIYVLDPCSSYVMWKYYHSSSGTLAYA